MAIWPLKHPFAAQHRHCRENRKLHVNNKDVPPLCCADGAAASVPGAEPGSGTALASASNTAWGAEAEKRMKPKYRLIVGSRLATELELNITLASRYLNVHHPACLDTINPGIYGILL
jgi:hypothetical protein